MKSPPALPAALVSAMLLLASHPASARPRPQGLPLAALLRRHLLASGPPAALRGAASMKTVYALDAGGMTGTLTEYEAPPSESRVEMALGPVRQTTADNGRTAWEQDASGHVRLVSGPELAETRATQSFSVESYDPLHGSRRGSVTLRPQREAGTGDYVLDLTPTGGARQTLYLDPHTYLVRKMVATQSGITGAVEMLSYRRVGGQQIPSRLRITYAGLPLTVSARLVSAQRGLHFAAGLFAPPASSQDFAFLTPTGHGPATVPFEDVGGEIVLAVAINGQTRRLLLDSGAGSSFLTAGAAQGLNLATSGSVPTVGYGGAAGTGAAAQATLELPGAVRIQGQRLFIIRSAGAAQAFGRSGAIDGALGYDLFARLTVTIDYNKKTLTLADPRRGPALAKNVGIQLPLRLETRTPSVAASVDGRSPGRFLIDTGDNGAVHLFPKYARANGLLPAAGDPGAQVLVGQGIGGTVRETVTTGHTLKVGTVTLRQVPLATIGGGGITDVLDQAGGIGVGVLRKFVVTFDYAHSRLILQKPADFTPALGSIKINSGPARTFCPAPRLTLAGLLKRHLQALGGAAAVQAVQSTRVVAQVHTGGITGTTTTLFAVPDREYEEDKIGILDIVQAYDGKTAWRRDTNGNTRTLGGEEVKNLRNQLFFDTNSYVIPGRIPGKETLRPRPDPATGDYVIDALPEGGKPTTLLINPKTFLIDREQHMDDDVQVVTTFGHYRAVDGVEFPFTQHTTNGTPRYDISVKTLTLENNVRVASGLFSEPSGGGKFAFVTPGATSATVPFDLDDGEIGLSVTINGQPERVYLDSGASGIALAKRTADALHLPQSGFVEGRGYGGSADLLPVKVGTFEVPGAVRLSDVAAVAVPLPEDFGGGLARPVAGFVGYDLLSHFVVRVDYPKRQITFIAPDRFQPTATDGQSLPIDLAGDIPTITARLDDLPPARYLMDTGDAAFLRFYGPYVTQNKLDQKYPRGIESFGGGIGGLSKARETRIGSFTVAGVALHGVPADFSQDAKGGVSQLNAGSLGTALLGRFVVTFDYPHNRVFFGTVRDTTRPFDLRTTGMELAADGKRILVAAVRPNSTAQFAGVHTLDEVLSVDGTPATQLGLDGVRRLLSGGGGKASHVLVVRSSIGSPRTVTVPLFDPLPDTQ